MVVAEMMRVPRTMKSSTMVEEISWRPHCELREHSRFSHRTCATDVTAVTDETGATEVTAVMEHSRFSHGTCAHHHGHGRSRAFTVDHEQSRATAPRGTADLRWVWWWPDAEGSGAHRNRTGGLAARARG